MNKQVSLTLGYYRTLLSRTTVGNTKLFEIAGVRINWTGRRGREPGRIGEAGVLVARDERAGNGRN